MCIGDKDGEIRVAALNAVAEITLEQKLPCPKEIIDAIFHTDPMIRELSSSYIDALTPIPAEFTPRLLEAIASKDPAVRANVSNALAQFGLKDKRTVPALRKATKDEVFRVRHNAFAALFKATRDYDSVLPFWLELADGHYEFPPRDENGREASTMFVDGEEKLHGTSAAFSIRRAGRENPQAVGKVLLKLLSDKTVRSRRSAATALGILAGDNPKTREALNKLAAREALAKLKDDADESVRGAAQNALNGFTRKVSFDSVPQDDTIVGVGAKTTE